MRLLTEMPLRDLLMRMGDPRKQALLNIYDDHGELFHHATGSSHNHQAWKGGYADHIAECIRVNIVTYEALGRLGDLPFTEDQATVALFFHDFEKPFRYGWNTNNEVHRWASWHRQWMEGGDGEVSETYAGWEAAKWEIIRDFERRYDFALNHDEANAVRYCHGEGDDHSKTRRVQLPLAAHVHHCDNSSARIWPNGGKGKG